MAADGLPLAALTALVERVRATSKKNEKVGLIADVLRQARGREAELLAMYLTGTLPQGRIGLGWSAVHAALEAAPPPRDEPLALLEVDRAFEALAGERGAGSGERRTRA
ncbi:MAG TPA: ATP-dependent DNA ligase, partial [Vicinamibacteria bacterium]|nr:ATP-dependent DNA ligase [Vicinamibacteria bacterium]